MNIRFWINLVLVANFVNMQGSDTTYRARQLRLGFGPVLATVATTVVTASSGTVSVDPQKPTNHANRSQNGSNQQSFDPLKRKSNAGIRSSSNLKQPTSRGSK